MNHFIDSTIKPFNTKDNPKVFENTKELYDFVKYLGVGRRQEFWFVVKTEPGTLFGSLPEYEHEG